MPIFAGMVASIASWFVAWFGAKLSYQLALAAACVSVYLAAVAALKVAGLALLSGISAYGYPTLAAGIAYALPGNLAACMTALFIADSLVASYNLWLQAYRIGMSAGSH